MFRLLLIVSVLLLVAICATKLAALGGTITAIVGGYEIETSLVVLVAATLLLTLALYLCVSVIRAIFDAPHRLKRSLEERKYKHGFEEVTHALTAIAVGDAGKAKRHLAKTTRLLPQTPLTHILGAQIAGLERNQDDLKRSLEALLEHKSTTPLAHRGLAELHLRQGNLPHAIHYAEHALKSDPRNLQTGLNLLSLHVRNGEWEKAYALLRDRNVTRTLKRAGTKLMHAKVKLAEALSLRLKGDPHGALDRAEIAHHLAPYFLPATLELLGLYVTHKRIDNARKLLLATWKERPHPNLTTIAFHLPGDEVDREKLIQKLVKSYPHHTETHTLEGMLALDTNQLAASRTHLRQAIDINKSRRVFELMARLEVLEYQDSKTQKDWLEKAALLPRDAAWKCSDCGHESPHWTLLCESCNAFDTVDWR
jgi:HemY protein